MVDRFAKAWLAIAGVLLLVVLVSSIVALDTRALTDRFFREQDLPVLLAISAVAAILKLSPVLVRRLGAAADLLAQSSAFGALATLGRRPGAMIVAAVLVGLVTSIGVWLVCDGYPLSLDEFMATFGAVIHGHGELMARVATPWRGYVPALQPEFLFATAGGAYWTSSYLPVNAALRALGGLIGAQALIGPALAALSVAAVHGIARKVWPDRPSAAVVAAVLLATSSQLLVTAMTPYAMTAHLAFNLVWLWLFLRGGRLGHAGAIAVGFLACGLHQLVFHPLFVAPFIAQAWMERRWRLASLYTLAYGAICLFWIEYWSLATAWSGAASVVASMPANVAAPTTGALRGFGAQVIHLLRGSNLAGFGLMAKNLVRFVVWQNPLLVALMAVGAAGAIRAGGTMRSLFAGLVLGAVAMLILLPYQGHGWGYRYLHGFLGSAALIAARQWVVLTDDLPSSRRPAAWAGFQGVALASMLALLPLHAWQAHAFIDPYARANAAIRRSAADVVLLDESDSWFTVDLVRNDPYLRNRPLVFRLGALDDAQVGDLCARHTLALFDARVAGRYGIRVFAPSPGDATALARLRAVGRLACGSTRLPVGEIE